MATSSILGGDGRAQDSSGKDMEALGPSDNSDSGSDALGAYGDGELDSDSDSVGTGERASAGTGMERADADILPDRVEGVPGSGENEDSGDDAARDAEGLALDDDSDDDEANPSDDAASGGRS